MAIPKIRELTLRSETRHPRSGYHGTAVYNETGGLPWYRETETARLTKEEAWADALVWAQQYNMRDRYGNMASAFGVIDLGPTVGWRGVVNYFHSNT